MAIVRGCNFPDDLYYNVETNVWARREGDGNVVIGMTAYAAALAGQIVSCTPKKIGRPIQLNKPAVTVESGKWVGPVRSPVAGEVVAINDALAATPGMVNADPYGSGWMIRLKPDNWDSDSAALVTGGVAARAFEARMAAEGFAGCQA